MREGQTERDARTGTGRPEEKAGEARPRDGNGSRALPAARQMEKPLPFLSPHTATKPHASSSVVVTGGRSAQVRSR
uniref:Uncharacterized protein n=1 Tax=Setaria viridis TaxID=4556 RepID=A0A4U6VCD5_SETVI|nr:hypothetical protein SEVIR_3G180450v2 [Setaria viridis]